MDSIFGGYCSELLPRQLIFSAGKLIPATPRRPGVLCMVERARPGCDPAKNLPSAKRRRMGVCRAGGRGEAGWTSVVNSLNNVVLALAQTGAHEVGHLVGYMVGLRHVEQIGIMDRSATLAFLRELEFTRSQAQFERRLADQVIREVFTTIVQDPEVYFRSVFQPLSPTD